MLKRQSKPFREHHESDNNQSPHVCISIAPMWADDYPNLVFGLVEEEKMILGWIIL